MKKKDPIEEARRYVDNARKVLKENTIILPETESYDDPLEAVGKRDRKLLDYVDNGYMVMHLYMNYDGIQNKDVCQTGFRLANAIIDRCEVMLPKSA